VGSYSAHPERVLGAVDRFRATACDEWRDLVKAAVAAGAKPTGAFSLRDGSRVLATFEVGISNGLRTQLLLVDAPATGGLARNRPAPLSILLDNRGNLS
jgi:hypothetical protein